MPERLAEVVSLLALAEASHGEYEARELGGAFDHNWPRWYAEYLLAHGLDAVLLAPLGKDQLARLLAECDRAYRREQPEEDWTLYYARRLLDTLPSPP